jgi:predicted ester cyclase
MCKAELSDIMLVVERDDPSMPERVGKEDTVMSTEENKALARREAQELWNHTGNLDAAEELYASDQAEDAKQEAADFRRAFPDVQCTIEDLIAEGDKVVVCWRSRGTHQGHLTSVNLPPTGKEVDFTGISIYRIEGGKIVEAWGLDDRLGLLRQLGAVPEPGQEGVEPSH